MFSSTKTDPEKKGVFKPDSPLNSTSSRTTGALAFVSSYTVLLEILLLVGLCVLQVFVNGCDLSLFIIDGLVQRLQLLLNPLVSLLFGGELAATALLGVQVCPLLCSLGQSGGGATMEGVTTCFKLNHKYTQEATSTKQLQAFTFLHLSTHARLALLIYIKLLCRRIHKYLIGIHLLISCYQNAFKM